MASDRMTVKLVYRDSDSYNDDDAKRFITLASKDLADVFTNGVNNSLVLLIFTSKEIFLSRETDELRRKVDRSLVFTDKFCSLLKERDDIPNALNQLLNLTDRNLDNYEKKIRKLFSTLLPGELLVEEVRPNQNVQNEIPSLPPRQLGEVIPQAQVQRHGTASDEGDGW